jgi:hypothetical protein
VAIIPTTFPATLDERAEYLGPVLLEGDVALKPAFQHASYTVLSFRPPECCSKRSKGVEKPIELRQRDLVDKIFCRNESAPIEGADPARQGILRDFGIRYVEGFTPRNFADLVAGAPFSE